MSARNAQNEFEETRGKGSRDLGSDARYLVACPADLTDSVIVEVVPISDLDLGPKTRMHGLHSNFGEGGIDI